MTGLIFNRLHNQLIFSYAALDYCVKKALVTDVTLSTDVREHKADATREVPQSRRRGQAVHRAESVHDIPPGG